MAEFVLFLRDTGSYTGEANPADIQAIIQKYVAWGDRLRAAGKMVAGQKLHDGEGRLMRPVGSGPASITDGPFTEAKEVLGGFFILNAADYDEAVALASDCPHLEFGTIEIRRVEVVAGA
jgi:hypothetical protein